MSNDRPLIASARMYAAAPEGLWRDFFAWLARASGVPLEAVAHPWPAPLAALWAREDLGAAFMCGLPYCGWEPRPQILAAPVPAGARYGGRPVYVTDFVARAGLGIASLAEAGTLRLALTTRGSHSGYNAVRHHFAAHYGGRVPVGAIVGPVETPRRAVEALLEGRADLAALDGWAFDLLRRHAPEVAPLRIVESSAPAPIPPLVAASTVPAERVAALRAALLGASDDPAAAPLLTELELRGFAAVAPEDYAVIARRREQADAAGVPELLEA